MDLYELQEYLKCIKMRKKRARRDSGKGWYDRNLTCTYGLIELRLVPSDLTVGRIVPSTSTENTSYYYDRGLTISTHFYDKCVSPVAMTG